MAQLAGVAVQLGASYVQQQQAQQQAAAAASSNQSQQYAARDSAAILAEQAAADRAALAEGNRDRLKELDRVLASRRARYAAGGVAPNEGSAAAVQAGLASDVAQINADAVDRYQRGSAIRDIQSASLTRQGQVLAGEGRIIKQQSNLIPYASGISAAAGVADELLTYRQRTGSDPFSDAYTSASGWF